MKNHPTSGFTLLEVLIALVIIAIALTAVSKAVSSNARNAAYIDNKTFAHWVGMNVLAKYQLLATQRNFVGQYNDTDTTELANHTWYWTATVNSTMIPNNYKIEVRVSDKRNGSALDTIDGFLYHEAKDA